MYETLASLYDLYMEDVPYEKWLDNICSYMQKYCNNPKTVLDLGCGTGTMSVLLKKKGFDVTGIDISADMLAEASSKAFDEGLDIVFSQQDMKSFEAPFAFDVIISLCDCINYITDPEELGLVFESCRKNLAAGGLFIFDINSRHKLRNILGDGSFCSTDERSAFTCENFYDDEDNICRYYVNLFIEDEDGRYSRYEELHRERGYTEEEIRELLEKSGFKVYETADADTLGKVTDTTERIYFISGKELV